MSTATQPRRMFIEYGIRMSETPRRGEFRVVDEKTLADAVTGFKRIAPMLESRTFGEPTFREMMALPEIGDFMSHFKERKLHFEFAAKMNSGTLQKAVIIADEDFRPLAIVRWVNGQGKPFFYHDFSENHSDVGGILASIESKARAAEPGAPAIAVPSKEGQPTNEGWVNLSEACKGGDFRIPDTGVALQSTIRAFTRVVPDRSFHWAMRERFDAMKVLSEARDFIAKFKETKLRFELAGKIENEKLVDAAVFIMAGSSRQPVAAMRWISGQGNMFFQNFLLDTPEPVGAVLASIETRANAAQAPK